MYTLNSYAIRWLCTWWLKRIQHECKMSVATMSGHNACKTTPNKNQCRKFLHVLFSLHVYCMHVCKAFSGCDFFFFGHLVFGWVNDSIRFATFTAVNKCQHKARHHNHANHWKIMHSHTNAKCVNIFNHESYIYIDGKRTDIITYSILPEIQKPYVRKCRTTLLNYFFFCCCSILIERRKNHYQH